MAGSAGSMNLACAAPPSRISVSTPKTVAIADEQQLDETRSRPKSAPVRASKRDCSPRAKCQPQASRHGNEHQQHGSR